MSLDIILIYLLLFNNYYYKYNTIIDINYYKVNNREIYRLLYSLNKIRETREDDISVEDLMLYFYSNNPSLKPAEQEAFSILFDRMREIDVSEDSAERYFQAHMDRVRAHEIATIAIDVAEGKKSFDLLEEAISGDKKDLVIDASQFVTDDLQELYEQTRHKQGLRWPLECLNQSMGSLRPGDFGFIIARPETGKTTFLSHITTFMTEQHDGNTLWINNEEQGTKVKVRNFQSLLGTTSDELFANIAHSNSAWASRIGSRLRLYDDASISYRRVEQLAKELQPKLIVIDQLDKLKGMSGEGHGMLKELYQWARELAKKYNCPVIGVSQAGATAEDKFYLSMDDIDGSKTGKPGEADWILGIGKEESKPPMLRGLCLIKNKLSGDDDSISALRHGKFSVFIEPEIARYSEMK